jgi:hypothetical protein
MTYIWLECPICHGPYVMLSRVPHEGEDMREGDFLHADLTPYRYGEDVPLCLTCGKLTFTPSAELVRTGDELPFSRQPPDPVEDYHLGTEGEGLPYPTTR